MAIAKRTSAARPADHNPPGRTLRRVSNGTKGRSGLRHFSGDRWHLVGRSPSFQGGKPEFELVYAVAQYLEVGLIGQPPLGSAAQPR
jgi:hypothetical protein